MKFALVVLIGCGLLRSCFAEAEIGMHTRQIADSIEKKIKELNPEASVTVEKITGLLTVQWNVREFMVHRRNMVGEWSKKAYSITGPDNRGCLISVYFHPGAYAHDGQAARGPGPIFKGADNELYFSTTFSLLEWENINAQVNISFGNKADTALMQKVYDEFVAAANLELGAPEKAFGVQPGKE